MAMPLVMDKQNIFDLGFSSCVVGFQFLLPVQNGFTQSCDLAKQCLNVG